MTDDADTIAKKIRKAKTDPDPLPEASAGWPTAPRRATS
jgi:tryptophanyl-tRNA synthetase